MAETRIPLDTWVNLPRLGKDAFKELMKAGVQYTTGKGFLFRTSSNLQAAKRVVASAVDGQVYFIFKCYICGSDASCADCSYKDICSIEDVGGRCICLKCSRENLAAYRSKWQKGLDGP